MAWYDSKWHHALCRPGAYNGAKIEPVLPTFLKFQERLLSTEHVDLVLPMTHQAISDDRKMAGQIQGIPVICGGMHAVALS
jgi:hypothetical protein